MNDNLRYSLLALYFLAVILLELGYRYPLFDYSLELLSEWDKKDFWLNKFFESLTKVGQNIILLPCYFILFIFTSLSYSMTYLCTLCSSYYIVSLFKLIYRQHRPFWERDFKYHGCSGGFGNPSGHALNSVSSALAFIHIFMLIISQKNGNSKTTEEAQSTDKEISEKKQLADNKMVTIIKVLFASIISIIYFSVCFSRFYLKVHSLNQILFGALLGFGIYILFFWVFRLQDFKDSDLRKLVMERQIVIQAVIVALIIPAFVLWLTFPQDDEITKIILLKCPEIDKNRVLSDNSFMQSLVILGISGAALGLYFLFRSIPTEDSNSDLKKPEIGEETKTQESDKIIINFNTEMPWKNKVKLIILIGVIMLLSLIPWLIFCLTNLDDAKVFFNLSFPYFVISFCNHYIVIRLSLKSNWVKTNLNNKVLV